MTDNEIIKALECCSGDGEISFCHKCKIYDSDNCQQILCQNAFDLINRQKAEIERLQKDLTKCKLEKEMLYHIGKEIKDVAIKDFAEGLRKMP